MKLHDGRLRRCHQDQLRQRETVVESSEVEQESESWEAVIPIQMEDQAETTNSRSVEVPQSVPTEESEISTSPGESASAVNIQLIRFHKR